MADLVVPDDVNDADTLTAAMKYAAAGWFVLPVRPETKHPGSVVGAQWQTKSSRDPKTITTWFAGTNHAIALHVGRSGGIVFDVDAPDAMPDVLRDALEELEPPFQSTRSDEPRRGHYVFAAEPGRYGNSLGSLGRGWGEVRGWNGIIVAAPSVHAKAAAGGRYQWMRTGPVPELPPALAAALRPPSSSTQTAGTTQARGFLAGLPPGPACRAVAAVPLRMPATGRHDTMRDLVLRLVRLGEQGHRGVREALAELEERFIAAVAPDRAGGGLEAAAEYDRALAGAVAVVQAKPTPEADRGCCPDLPPVYDLGEEQAEDADEEPAEDADAEGTEWTRMSTWAPVDMRPVTSGNYVRPEPEIGARNDGVPVLYPGKEHVVASEPESGKTWLVCLIVTQVLEAGGRVLYVDFEDDALTIGARLLDLGADPEVLNDQSRFRYVSPAEAATAALWERLLDFHGEPPTLVVLDGTTEGYSLHGWEVNAQEDAAKWRRGFIRPALRLGAATLATDHVVKDREKRNGFAIGGQHKKAGLTGALFELVNVSPFGAGLRGRSQLLIHKDRPGGLRRHGIPLDGQPRTTHFADLVLAADVATVTPDGRTTIHCELEAVERTVDDRSTADPEVELGRQILIVLREYGPHSGQRLEAAVPGKAARIRRAVERLYHLGEVCRGWRGSKPTAWHLPNQCTAELHPERTAEEGSE